MLRFRADIRTLAFVAFYYVFLTTSWIYGWRSPWLIAGLTVGLALTSWICAVITHNTLHSPVFRNRLLNKAFQVALTCAYGFPVSEYVPGHNLSHHKHTQKNADLMRTSKVRSRIQLVNAALFFPRVAFDIFTENYRYVGMMKRAMPNWYRQLLIEMVFGWGTKIAFLIIDWRKALLFVFLPHLFAVWGITSVNFVQHDGCDEDHPYNHSRNFVGRVFNFITFNNGFHGIHHVHPGLHWSLTPAAHEKELHAHIHPALEQKSLFIYLVRTFLVPGSRVRYDGDPVVLPPAAPDEEWIPKSIHAAIADLGAEGTALADGE